MHGPDINKFYGVKKNISPRQLNESEYEELIRLRAENAYIKAENEVIKRVIGQKVCVTNPNKLENL